MISDLALCPFPEAAARLFCAEVDVGRNGCIACACSCVSIQSILSTQQLIYFREQRFQLGTEYMLKAGIAAP
jgi:hypothetical protein